MYHGKTLNGVILNVPMRTLPIIFLLSFPKFRDDLTNKRSQFGNCIELEYSRINENSFHRLLLDNEENLYVDRSMFIEEFLKQTNSGRTILVTQPKGSGKTVNLDMTETFLQIELDRQCLVSSHKRTSRKLFVGAEIKRRNYSKVLKPLDIASRSDMLDRYQGNFPVISVNFGNVAGGNYREIESELEKLINRLISRFEEEFCLEKDNTVFSFVGEDRVKRLGASLAELSELLFKRFLRKSFILIDQYDTPILNSYISFGEHDDFFAVLNLFGDLLHNAFKRNDYLEGGLISGVLPILRSNLGPNNVIEYTMYDEKFSNYYGFTDEDLRKLLDLASVVNKSVLVEKIKTRSYKLARCTERSVYAPWAVMKCLSGLVAKSESNNWNCNEEKSFVNVALTSDEIQEDVQKLNSDRTIEFYFDDDVNLSYTDKRELFLNILLYSGYLKLNVKNSSHNVGTYQNASSVPNREIKNLYRNSIVKWVSNKLNINDGIFYNSTKLLASGKITEWENRLRTILNESQVFNGTVTKTINFAKLFYRGLFLSITHVLSANYLIVNKQRDIDVYFDVLLLPLENTQPKHALIFKYAILNDTLELNSTAQVLLARIDHKRYISKMRRAKIENIICICTTFNNNEIGFKHKTEKMPN